jgi:hypothetical protein
MVMSSVSSSEATWRVVSVLRQYDNGVSRYISSWELSALYWSVIAGSGAAEFSGAKVQGELHIRGNKK